MKKILLSGAVLSATILSSFAVSQTTQAACGSFFEVGSDTTTVSACTGLTEEQQIQGFSIDVNNNKITLENYDGGAILYLCRATCEDVKTMEIELIGDNAISSLSSSEYLQNADIPKGAAFLNIIPTFTGSGTLKISAAIPFAFENPNLNIFSIDLVGPEYSNVVIEEQTVTEETATTGQTTKPTENCNSNSAVASFFDTTTGLAVLIAVPTVLLIIILILLAALSKKNKTNVTPPTTTSTPPANPAPTSTPTPTSTPAPEA